jgi:uncharacterized protein
VHPFPDPTAADGRQYCQTHRVLIMRLLLVLLIAVAGIAVPARAQSFDCAKATTPQEHLICGSASLRRLDSQLGQEYTRLVAGLSAVARTDVRRGQREWLAYWPVSCRDARGPLDPQSPDAAACAERAYADRIAALQADTVILGDIPLYPRSRYRIARSTAEVDPSALASETTDLLRVDVDAVSPSRKPLARAIQQWLAAREKADEPLDTDRSLALDERLVPSLPFLVSTTSSTFAYVHGAAYPRVESASHHFITAEQRPLIAGDIFTGVKWKDVLTSIIEPMLRVQLDGMYATPRDELRALVISPERWNFDAEALTVHFSAYEVAPHVAGAPAVTIPWAALRPLLTEQVLVSLRP